MNETNPTLMFSFLIQQHFQFHFPGMHINATHRMYWTLNLGEDTLFPSRGRPKTTMQLTFTILFMNSQKCDFTFY
jgi:hypothetical protein